MADDVPSSLGSADGISRRNVIASAAAGLFALSSGVGFPRSTPANQFGFSSFPDFFNWDIPYPQPGYEEVITWFIETMKKDGAEFSGEPIWHVNRSPDSRPPENMTIPDEVRRNGPDTVGTLVRTSGTDTKRTGVFS